MSDEEARGLLKGHYLTEELSYPDVDVMAFKMQEIADHIADYYNKLYDLIESGKKIDPWYNYDKFTDSTGKSDGRQHSWGNGNSLYSEFPMDSTTSKDVNKSVNDSDSHNEGDTKNEIHAHEYGNIGVQTAADIEEKTEQMYARLYRLKERWAREFTDLFMITM